MNLNNILTTIVAISLCQSVFSKNVPDSIIGQNAMGVVVARSYFEYDANGYQTSVAHYTWNKDKLEWVGTYREKCKYDDAGRVLTKNTFNWNFNKYDWMGMQQLEMEYDAKGRQTLRAEYKWDKNKNKWVGIIKAS